MKVLLIKLVGVQIPEEFQMKHGIHYVQEAGKKKKVKVKSVQFKMV